GNVFLRNPGDSCAGDGRGLARSEWLRSWNTRGPQRDRTFVESLKVALGLAKRSLQTGLSNAHRHVAASVLQYAAELIGCAAKASSDRIRKINCHQNAIDLVHGREQVFRLVGVVCTQRIKRVSTK